MLICQTRLVVILHRSVMGSLVEDKYKPYMIWAKNLLCYESTRHFHCKSFLVISHGN